MTEIILIALALCVVSVALNVGLVIICVKLYTEIVKEATIRRRYEQQGSKAL